MKMTKRILPLFVVLGILLTTVNGFALSISAKGGFVLNTANCSEVYSYNGDTPLVPASMTKVMAVYAIYDAMERGQISKDTQIPIGAALASYSRNPGYSNVVLSAGASYSLDELLGAIFVVSANAAVMAVGDYLWGSEANFVARMNQFITDWGIDAKFYDCTGVSSTNRVTPRAMATIANRLVTDYPDCLNYAGMTELNFRGQTYYATNKMLPGKAYAYEGTLGLKTGTTSAAGACVTAVTERDGVRLVSVVMGAPYSNGRYTDSIAMLDYAFEQVGTQIQEEELPPVSTRVYLNDTQIPGFVHRYNEELLMVRVEDLRAYGFDVTYEADTNTLVVVNNPDAMITGISANDFPESLRVYNPMNVNVVLKNAGEDIGIYTEAVYDANGQAAINVQELTYLGWVIQKGTTATIVTR